MTVNGHADKGDEWESDAESVRHRGQRRKFPGGPPPATRWSPRQCLTGLRPSPTRQCRWLVEVIGKAPAGDETVSRCARSWTACSGWWPFAGRVVRPEPS